MIRTLLVVGCLVLLAVCLYAMRRGWVRRGDRQSWLPAPADVPVELSAPLLAPLTGLYVGMTTTRSWQDRIVAHGLGLRANATATLHAQGLLIEREGADPVFIPVGSFVSAGVGAGLAGKVMGAGGLLIVRWALVDHEGTATELDTGLRSDDKTVYPAWVREIEKMGVSA